MDKFKIKVVCQHCGREKLVYPSEAFKFCSRSCANKGVADAEEYDTSLNWKRGSGNLWDCPYNVGVGCEKRTCVRCGWNPKVAQERIEAFLEEVNGHGN